MENSNLHLTIREERIKQGLSQKELGEMVGLPQQAINRIEQGQRKLDVELFEKLCKALKITKIGSFTVNFISSYYEMDTGNDPICYVDNLEDELSPDGSLSYDNSYSFASQKKEQGEKTLLADYRGLNEIGQLEARKRVSELTELPRYTKSDDPPQD